MVTGRNFEKCSKGFRENFEETLKRLLGNTGILKRLQGILLNSAES